MVETSTATHLTSRVIQDEAEWDAIRDDWETVYASSPYSSTFLDFAWLRGWWQVYGARYGTGGLRVVTVWRASQLIGTLPLYIGRGAGNVRHLRFISTGEGEHEETCPDYLNVLCLPGEEETCVDSMWDELGRMTWDHLELLDLAEDSPLLRARTIPHNAQQCSRGSCLVADLNDGFEAYLKQLSSKTRKHFRQLLREGEARAHFEIVDIKGAAGAFDDLVRLHQERWFLDGKPGAFAAPRFTEFHRHLVRAWLPSGRAILARLSLAGEPLAVVYGFITGQKFDFYQSGVRREIASPIRSPGTLVNLLLMRALTERGVTAYDFLRGCSPYKERLATRENQLVQVQLWRPTMRAARYRLLRLARRAVGKGQRIMRRG